MDITIRIGNKVVEGVKPSTVKLTINNVDPFTVGERTNVYSATVKVPRTETNDAIFASERFPMFYTKRTCISRMCISVGWLRRSPMDSSWHKSRRKRTGTVFRLFRIP